MIPPQFCAYAQIIKLSNAKNTVVSPSLLHHTSGKAEFIIPKRNLNESLKVYAQRSPFHPHPSVRPSLIIAQ